VEAGPALAIYSVFLSNQMLSKIMLNKQKNDEKVQNFLFKCQKNSGILDKDLEMLLEIPSKHIHEYEPVFTSLIELAPEGIMLKGLKNGKNVIKSLVTQLTSNNDVIDESGEIMLRLVKLVDNIPDDFPIWVKTRTFVLQDEAFVRFEAEKKSKTVSVCSI